MDGISVSFLVEAIKVTFEDPLAHGGGFSAGPPTSIYAKGSRTSGSSTPGCNIWQFCAKASWAYSRVGRGSRTRRRWNTIAFSGPIGRL